MKYRSSDVIKAITGSPGIDVDTALARCPIDGDAGCARRHGSCPLGARRQCRQKVSVFIGGCLRHLIFYFTVSAADHDGFIDGHDSQLRILVDEGLIGLDAYAAMP